MRSAVLAALAVLLLAGPAWASEAPSVAPEAFAEAQSCSLQKSVGMLSQFGVPEPSFMSCNATYDCPTSTGTTPISCNGTTSCTAEPYQVTCDGQTTYCSCMVGTCTCYCDCLAAGGGTCALQCKFEC